MLVRPQTSLTPKKELHSRALSALSLLTTTIDPLEREKAFLELREAVEKETSLISQSDLDTGVFDLYSIEWKWRLLSELSHDLSPAWAEAALAIYRWTAS